MPCDWLNHAIVTPGDASPCPRCGARLGAATSGGASGARRSGAGSDPHPAEAHCGGGARAESAESVVEMTERSWLIDG